jgi:hypothetical protein
MPRKRAAWFSAGDRVRVKQMSGRPGPTLWEIVTVDHDSGFCTIREIDPARPDLKYAAQEFDTSCLLLEPKEKHAVAFERYLSKTLARR